MNEYLPVVVLMVLGILFAVGSFVASGLLAPSRVTQEKMAPYECGIIPGREPPQRFPVRFYLVAMMFVIFDIEIIFLYPYAVAHEALGRFGLVAILVFSVLVFESFVYLISKGAIDWGPLQVNSPIRTSASESAVDPNRSSTSTVRRVGGEGRAPLGADRTHRTPSVADPEPAMAGDH